MRHRRKTLFLSIGALFALTGLFVAACGDSGIDEDEHDAVQQRLAAEESRAQALEQELSAAEERAQEMEAELASTLTNIAERVVVLAAVPVDPPEPRPEPTPLPEGEGPPPPPSPPDAYFEPVGDFIFVVETIASGGAVGDEEAGYWAYDPSCVQSSTFTRSTRIVWRIEVIDPATGTRVLDDVASVKVVLPHGEERDMRFSQRGGGRNPDAPWMWATSWDIPADYPVGSLDFQVVVEHEDGRSGVYADPYIKVEIIDGQTEL